MVNTFKYAWSRLATYVTGNTTDTRLPILTGIVGVFLFAFSAVRLFSHDFDNYAFLTFGVLIVTGAASIPKRAGSAMNPLPIPIAAISVIAFTWGSPGAVIIVCMLAVFIALVARGSLRSDPWTVVVVPSLTGLSVASVWALTWLSSRLVGHTEDGLSHEAFQTWINDYTEYVVVFAVLLTLWAPLDAAIGAWVKTKSRNGRLSETRGNPYVDHAVLTGLTVAAAVTLTFFGFYRDVLLEVLPVAIPVVILLLVAMRGLPGTASSARSAKATQVNKMEQLTESLGKATTEASVDVIVRKDFPEALNVWAASYMGLAQGKPANKRGRVILPLKWDQELLGWLALDGRDPYSDHELDDLAVSQLSRRVYEIYKNEREIAALAEVEDRAAYLAERVDEEHKLFAAAQHEVGNPLAIIDGYLGLMRMGVLDEGEKVEALSAMQLASKRIKLVSQSLLTLAAAERGQVSPTLEHITLSSLVAPMTVEYRYMFEDSSVTVTTATPDATVLVDVMWVRQVVDNLVSNAGKATREGGDVSVKLTVIDQDLQVQVTDTGTGIPEEDLATVREAFIRSASKSNRKVPGVGLGLYIVTGLMGLHGGRLEITSSLSVGTTVTATFTGVLQDPQTS